MRNLIVFLGVILSGLFGVPALAWDGFDAETTELVEIKSEEVPAPGAVVELHNHDRDVNENVIVETVQRNRRTIEVVVLDQQGVRHTLVMENI